MSWFAQRSAKARSRRWWWMLALYAAFVTSVGLSTDREALLAQVQAMVESPPLPAAGRSASTPQAQTGPEPSLRQASAR